MQTLIRRRVRRRLMRVCTICQFPSPGFTDYPLYTALWHHSDKNSAAINNRYLDFKQTRGLILFVIDKHVDNNLKNFGVFVPWLDCNQSTQNAPIAYMRAPKRQIKRYFPFTESLDTVKYMYIFNLCYFNMQVIQRQLTLQRTEFTVKINKRE